MSCEYFIWGHPNHKKYNYFQLLVSRHPKIDKTCIFTQFVNVCRKIFMQLNIITHFKLMPLIFLVIPVKMMLQSLGLFFIHS